MRGSRLVNGIRAPGHVEAAGGEARGERECEGDGGGGRPSGHGARFLSSGGDRARVSAEPGVASAALRAGHHQRYAVFCNPRKECDLGLDHGVIFRDVAQSTAERDEASRIFFSIKRNPALVLMSSKVDQSTLGPASSPRRAGNGPGAVPVRGPARQGGMQQCAVLRRRGGRPGQSTVDAISVWLHRHVGTAGRTLGAGDGAQGRASRAAGTRRGGQEVEPAVSRSRAARCRADVPNPVGARSAWSKRVERAGAVSPPAGSPACLRRSSSR